MREKKDERQKKKKEQEKKKEGRKKQPEKRVAQASGNKPSASDSVTELFSNLTISEDSGEESEAECPSCGLVCGMDYPFEHPNYIGNAKQFTSSKKDVRPYFPPNDNWSGISSIIVTGGKWRLWGARNFKPPQINGDVEKGCYSFKGRDKVQSIERLQS